MCNRLLWFGRVGVSLSRLLFLRELTANEENDPREVNNRQQLGSESFNSRLCPEGIEHLPQSRNTRTRSLHS